MNLNLIKGFLDAIKPEPRLTVSEWADSNRILSPIAASEPGKWRTSRTPYLKQPMDCLSVYSSYERVVCMKGAQGGWTEMGNNWIGYIIDISPAPTLMVQPTDDTVKRNSKMRIDPMIQASEALNNKVSKQKSRSGENTITQKNFPGGILLMVGANSPVGLRSVPIRNLFLDEVDGYPIDLDGEGSPIELALARTRTFPKRKVFIISTPTNKSTSAINRAFEETDQNYFNVPCPHCGKYHILLFENLHWEKGKPETAKMVCPECSALIDEVSKEYMFPLGKYIPRYPENSSTKRIGFHWSSLYSPLGWFSWSEIAKMYEDAEKDPNKMKVFVNTVLGEPIEENGEAPQWQSIYNRRETYTINTIPFNTCFITAGVDVQKDRLELEIVAWCEDKQSYSIDFRVLTGQTVLPEVWSKLTEVLEETWQREDGIVLEISKMCIDTGYNTSEVHKYCRSQSIGRVIPIKGSHKLELAVSPPKQIDYSSAGKKIGKMKQWNIGVSKLKHELYGWLNIEPNTDGTYPANYCHFPQYDSVYFEGLTAEDFISGSNVWKKRFQRNEPLDCRIYARAASIIMGLDRMRPEQLKVMAGKKIEKAKEKIENKEPKKKRDSFWT